jgi:Ser/Thr protein kinase RdoA (MazF antagonist)
MGPVEAWAGAEVAHTTFAASAIARRVEAHHGTEPVVAAHLVRRGFGDVYQLRLAGGERLVARLGAVRPRGPANVMYEAAMLRHLLAAGIAVAEPVPTRDGEAALSVMAPEGERALFVTRFLEGESPADNLPDIEATGAGLARMHAAARNYAGPVSRYTLDLAHLVERPLERLLAVPDLEPALADAFRAEAAELVQLLSAADLVSARCHGDCHGYNNVMHAGADGTRQPRFFDFDDAAPGWLAYDLAVFRWSALTSKGLTDADEGITARWSHFLAGYRSAGEVRDADLALLGALQAVRHFWLIGEYAGRLHHWGAHTLAPAWLAKQPARLAAWRGWSAVD